jgi:hypothetical protein
MSRLFERFAADSPCIKGIYMPWSTSRHTEGVQKASRDERIRRDKEEDFPRRPCRLPNPRYFLVKMFEIVTHLRRLHSQGGRF